MLPQLHIIAYSKTKCTVETGNFIGLLGVARLCRILFWGISCVQQFYFDAFCGGMWAFILPDLIHTLVMFEYIWMWMQKTQIDCGVC